MIEAWLSRLLTAGVVVSAATALVGGVFFLVSSPHSTTHLRDYQPQPEGLTSPAAIAHDAAHLEPMALMQLGVLLLILTPIARVAFSLVLFAIKRDLLYVVITLLVLAALMVGLFGEIA